MEMFDIELKLTQLNTKVDCLHGDVCTEVLKVETKADKITIELFDRDRIHSTEVSITASIMLVCDFRLIRGASQFYAVIPFKEGKYKDKFPD